MKKYAYLKILRKLSVNKNHLFHTLYQIKKENGSIKDFLASIGEERFNSVDFKSHKKEIYYICQPIDLNEQEKEFLQKDELLAEWLWLFTYQEMSVKGDNHSGMFEAETEVALAIERLIEVKIIDDRELFVKKRNLLNWLMWYAEIEDRINCTFAKDLSVEETKKEINSKIKELKKLSICPHWKK